MQTSQNHASDERASIWQRWLHHPEKLWFHKALFQIHLWIGVVASLYFLVMSLSGSVIVFRNDLERTGDPNSRLIRTMEWVVNLHENLLLGTTGRSINGIGAICFTLLAIAGGAIWWPGIEHWRRSLTIDWKSSFSRLNWDWHNAIGFWSFLWMLIWGTSGIYFCFPDAFNDLINVFDPTGTSRAVQSAEMVFFSLSNLHFGRFGWPVETVWALLGLALAVLVVTGVFMYSHRLRFSLPYPSTRWRFRSSPSPTPAKVRQASSSRQRSQT